MLESNNNKEKVIPYSEEALRKTCSGLQEKRVYPIDSEEIIETLNNVTKAGDCIIAFRIKKECLIFKSIPDPAEGHSGWYNTIVIRMPESRCILMLMCGLDEKF